MSLLGTLGLTDDELNELEQVDDTYIQWHLNGGERKYAQEVREKLQAFITECPEDERKEARKMYLSVLMGNIETTINGFEADYKKAFAEGEEYVDRSVLAETISAWERENKRINAELKTLANNFVDDGKVKKAKGRKFSEFIELRRNMACCPFHDDKNPSFSVKNNRGKCWGCGWSGDIIDFVMQKQGFDFKQAINFLA